MNLNLLVLKPLLGYQVYVKYYRYLSLEFLEKNYPDVFRLYSVLPNLHQKNIDKIYGVDDLKVCFYTNYPNADTTIFENLFQQLVETPVEYDLLEGYLDAVSKQAKALQLARLYLQASEGVITFDEAEQRHKDILVKVEAPSDWRNDVVTSNLVELYEQQQLQPGLNWRLTSLQRALGPLRKGNFGFVFARPETGKTTFLASELTFMAHQAPGPIVWFNNEQAGPEVQTRIHQAACGWMEEEMRKDPARTQAQYVEQTRDNLILVDQARLDRKYVEGVCAEVNPSLIVFDQIDHIKGFKEDRNDLELKMIYQWARELGKEYGPTIGVCQAGATGENKKWLDMNDVDNSKTGKQGAADWILGIGAIRDSGSEYLRFLHLSKNKLAGGPDSDRKRRHDKWSVFIRPEIARYTDLS